MKTYETLESALDLIRDEKNWVQGTLQHGGRRCALGALMVAAEGNPREFMEAESILTALVRKAMPNKLGVHHQYSGTHARPVSFFNDRMPHVAVVELFQEGIRVAKAKAAEPVDVPEVPALSGWLMAAIAPPAVYCTTEPAKLLTPELPALVLA